jgi:hypothetical protein
MHPGSPPLVPRPRYAAVIYAVPAARLSGLWVEWIERGPAQRVALIRLPLFIVAALLVAIPALAHSWYPPACCGNLDCFQVACDQLVETGSGWFYVPTGNLFKREQVQPSQDPHCHVCLGRGREHRSICAFIVPNV